MNFMRWLSRNGIFFSWIIAVASTAVTLIIEYALGAAPCMLCWYQRIAMYPRAVMLGIAFYRNDGGVRRYALPLSGVGGLVALYHYLEQMVPGIAKLAPCTVGVPCSGRYLDLLGFITIPLLSILAFAAITMLLVLSKRSS